MTRPPCGQNSGLTLTPSSHPQDSCSSSDSLEFDSGPVSSSCSDLQGALWEMEAVGSGSGSGSVSDMLLRKKSCTFVTPPTAILRLLDPISCCGGCGCID